MSNKLTRYKKVEDWLCDYIDQAFNDDIVCDKEFTGEAKESRAIYIESIKDGFDDQSTSAEYTIGFTASTKKRSDAVRTISMLESLFPVYNKKIGRGLAISINMQYITTPLRTIIDSKSVYLVSATLVALTT